MLKTLIKIGAGFAMAYMVLITLAFYLDGKVFELENDMVLIKNGGIHVYSKRISVQYITDEQMKEGEQ